MKGEGNVQSGRMGEGRLPIFTEVLVIIHFSKNMVEKYNKNFFGVFV